MDVRSTGGNNDSSMVVPQRDYPKHVANVKRSVIANGVVTVLIAAAVTGAFIALMCIKHDGSAPDMMKALDGKLLVGIGGGAVGFLTAGFIINAIYARHVTNRHTLRDHLEDEPASAPTPAPKPVERTPTGFKPFDYDKTLAEVESAKEITDAIDKRKAFNREVSAISLITYKGDRFSVDSEMEALDISISNELLKFEGKLPVPTSPILLRDIPINTIWNEKATMTLDQVRRALHQSYENPETAAQLLEIGKMMSQYIGLRLYMKSSRSQSNE